MKPDRPQRAPQCHLCYRPTVFLLHLRHIALPAPDKEILGAHLKMLLFHVFFFFLKIELILKLRSFKILNSGNFGTYVTTI